MNTENKEPLGVQKDNLVVVIMGSESDEKIADEVSLTLEKLGVKSVQRVGSAHKTSEHVVSIIAEYQEQTEKDIVFIALAGRQNALAPFADAHTQLPVISLVDREDVMAGVRVPSGIGAPVTIYAEAAAIAAAKIIALNNPEVAGKILIYQRENRQKIVDADARIRSKNT